MDPFEVLRRYRTLWTHRLHSMPIAILMPHSTCNCRCVMCDIWKDNADKRQLDESALHQVLVALKKLYTQRVVFSGGEALMHPRLFDFCGILAKENIKVTILSSGLLLQHNARKIVDSCDEVIVSLDGSERFHNEIRRVPDAFQRLRSGVKAILALHPGFTISGRCVVQKANFRDLPEAIRAAKEMGLKRISFLAADLSTPAFNRPSAWDPDHSNEILLDENDLTELRRTLESVFIEFAEDFSSGFVAESPAKLKRILGYYESRNKGEDFHAPYCTAPWVSAVVEADGVVRPCYFHAPYGNIFEAPLEEVLNSPSAIAFRKELNIPRNTVCKNCVCSLNLKPYARVP